MKPAVDQSLSRMILVPAVDEFEVPRAACGAGVRDSMVIVPLGAAHVRAADARVRACMAFIAGRFTSV